MPILIQGHFSFRTCSL